MPFALVIGADPLCTTAGLAGYRIGESEADFAGALRQEPVELVKCETNDLLVPAHAEIVIEGEFRHDVVGPEGPFGEYPGYRVSEFTPKALLRIKAVTYRDDPIMTLENPGIPPDGSSVGGSVGVAIALKRRLQKHGFPVVDVHLPPEGASHLVVVSVKKGGHQTAKAIQEALTTRRAWYTKIIVVDDDIDIYDLGQVIHAWSVKCHSYKGIYLQEAPGKGGPATPAHSPEERSQRYGASACFDSTWPVEWPDEYIPVRSSFADTYPKELQEKIKKNWKTYGFK
jgi:4-hydroxy-3-polyprenylbenzoate decarboxylase